MRLLVKISYDGSNYFGFQRQKDALGIQAVIEKSLKNMTGTNITIHSAGRTDKGVHAKGQTFHFDSDLPLDGPSWKRTLNQRLPEDIRVISVKKVANRFHARHYALQRTYEYKISKTPSSVFRQRYEVYIKDFNYTVANKCIPLFLGKKDFTGFSKLVKDKDPVKEIMTFSLRETNTHYIFEIKANSFLRYMVRSIVGTIIDVATNKKDISIINEIFKTNDRKLAGKTAEARGLYLMKVNY